MKLNTGGEEKIESDYKSMKAQYLKRPFISGYIFADEDGFQTHSKFAAMPFPY